MGSRLKYSIRIGPRSSGRKVLRKWASGKSPGMERMTSPSQAAFRPVATGGAATVDEGGLDSARDDEQGARRAWRTLAKRPVNDKRVASQAQVLCQRGDSAVTIASQLLSGVVMVFGLEPELEPIAVYNLYMAY